MPPRTSSPNWGRLEPDPAAERRHFQKSHAGDPPPNPIRPNQLNATERRLLGLIYVLVEPVGHAGLAAAAEYLRKEHPRVDPRSIERVLEVYRRGERL